MRIKQEELPTPEKLLLDICPQLQKNGKQWDQYSGYNKELKFIVKTAIEEYLKLHLDRIRYEYDQYQFFLEGYKNGRASISEVNAAHDEFLKLLK